MISSFFIKSLQKQTSLVHGTSSRFYEKDGRRKRSLFPYEKKGEKLFLKHQKLFSRSLGIKNDVVFRTDQVHGCNVYILKDPEISIRKVRQQKADAIVTHLVDCPVIVLTADCVPIIIYDPVKYVTGVIHAGRLGTQKSILNNTIEVLLDVYGSKPKDLILGMGPAIGQCCYEVDEDCALPFLRKNSVNSEFVKKASHGKYFLDLPGLNCLEGLDSGVLEKNIYTHGPCTSCDNQRWYSYRKEGKTGRLMTLAMLRSKN